MKNDKSENELIEACGKINNYCNDNQIVDGHCSNCIFYTYDYLFSKNNKCMFQNIPLDWTIPTPKSDNQIDMIGDRVKTVDKKLDKLIEAINNKRGDV